MLRGTRDKYTCIVRTDTQALRPVNIGFHSVRSEAAEESIDYIKEVAAKSCATIYDEVCYKVEVIVDLKAQKVIYSVHKNRKKTINVLAKAVLDRVC